ncbi:Coiled-coil domain-containing protein 50 [Nymphon striatum]|nr:Coiled-coil domain-containing protein 50 [Nymphon striatum]
MDTRCPKTIPNQNHYGHNRTKNQLVRQDTQQAKHLQTEEEIVAAEVQCQLENMYLKQEEDDAKVALEVQEQLSQQELEKQRHLEDADEQYARHLQDREKGKLLRKKRERGLAKEQKQVEKALAHHTQKNNFDEYIFDDSNVADVSDFSDLCVQPTSDMNDNQSKALQEHQDEELARLLQEQETKRGTPSDHDKRLALETQDREIAKYLQEQERFKARKAKERVRLKAQQQKELDPSAESRVEGPVDVEHLRSMPILGCSEVLNVALPNDESPSSTYRTSERDDAHLSNIAIAIDPTYNRKPKNSQSVTSSVHSAPVTPAKSVFPSTLSSDRSSYQTEIRNLSPDSDYKINENYEDDPVPPYMPIQGQRRSGSLEKPGKKNKKDNCKSQ